jgi:hypothetical protein
MAWLRLNHVSGTKDAGYVVVGTTSTDCNGGGPYYQANFSLPSTDASDTVNLNVQFRAIFGTPGSPGPVTYYLNAIMSSGQDAADQFWYGNMTRACVLSGDVTMDLRKGDVNGRRSDHRPSGVATRYEESTVNFL